MSNEKGKYYAPGVILTLIGCVNMTTSFLSAVMFSVGMALIAYSYTDMIVHKDNNPYKYL